MADLPAETTIMSPVDVLPAVVMTLLAPLFAAACGGDMQRARAAAQATLESCQARTHTDLIATGQIVACGLAALSSIARSVEDSLSPSLMLRLRGNAVALNRAVEQNRRALRETSPDPAAARHGIAPAPGPVQDTNPRGVLPAAPEPAPTSILEPPALPASAEPAPPQPAAALAEEPKAGWGAVMADMAEAYAAELPHLPPAERRLMRMRASFLNSAAHELLGGGSGMPAEPWMPQGAPSVIRPAGPGLSSRA